MVIPGILISAATFPGVIVHELAHQLFCRWFRIPVFQVVYFQFASPVGYVLHERTTKTHQTILISVGPFLINSILGFLISFTAAWQLIFDQANALDYLLIYLGVSIGAHAFPSTGDASAMWESIKQGGAHPIVKVLVAPIVGFIYLGALGSFFWLDVIYGVAVALWFPRWVVEVFA